MIASFTSNPSKILGIDKGTLEKGRDADLCIFDLNKPWIVNKDKIKSKSKNTSIEDRKLQGQVLKTFVKVNKNWNNDAQYLSSLGVGSNQDAS